MSSAKMALAPKQEKEVIDFLAGLEQRYLSLDLTRQALYNNFAYLRSEDHANELLYDFRDRHILKFVDTFDVRWKWVRVATITDALVGIGWMSDQLDEKHRKSTAAVQSLLNCSPNEAERIWKDLEADAVVKFVSDYYGKRPALTDSRWRWESNSQGLE